MNLNAIVLDYKQVLQKSCPCGQNKSILKCWSRYQPFESTTNNLTNMSREQRDVRLAYCHIQSHTLTLPHTLSEHQDHRHFSVPLQGLSSPPSKQLCQLGQESIHVHRHRHDQCYRGIAVLESKHLPQIATDNTETPSADTASH